nr:MAG TPA: Major capsid protein [Microviridae sp.]
MKKTLGGDRLRSESKMEVYLPNFGRSSHNIGKIIRTTQACGTIVPYWCQIGLDGTTFYIDITTKVKTLPTTGPVFGSFKHQIDLFVIPVRLYIAALHNNALGVGLNMSKVLLPQFEVYTANTSIYENDTNRGQVNPSSLLSYLGIKGFGHSEVNQYLRRFPAIFNLAYWDIFKNYYANKQEEKAYVITGVDHIWKTIQIGDGAKWNTTWNNNSAYMYEASPTSQKPIFIKLEFEEKISPEEVNEIQFLTNDPYTPTIESNGITKLGDTFVFERTDPDAPGLKAPKNPKKATDIYVYQIKKAVKLAYKLSTTTGKNLITMPNSQKIKLTKFTLKNIDDERTSILAAPSSSAYIVENTKLPYMAGIAPLELPNHDRSKTYISSNAWFSQAGLAVKTYLSDRFNNWLNTEWIDGTTGGINAITAVDVTDGKLTMDALILQKKIFNMLNRVAITDGTYQAWREATYGIRSATLPESPIFCGGMQSEIAFDEIVSNAATDEEPLGTLAGRGVATMYKSGRGLKIKCTEPSMVMALGSITPRIDYSQGNKWWTRLETMDDFHKPTLDAIGFQELIAEEAAAWSTELTENYKEVFQSLGKQPSWIEYTTDVNETYGEFAAGMPLAFMCLNRVYEESVNGTISNPSTYIDPTIYNNIFAESRLSSQNFWVQVAFDVTARRVMSAKQIPNL